MAISKKPAALNLSGNLPDFHLQYIVAPLVFKLYKNGILLLEETYHADSNQEIIISIKELVENELSLQVPAFGQNFFEQTNGYANFKATVGTEEVLFTVIKGGVDVTNLDPDNFLASNFLTWQPQQKSVQYYDPEWLTYYAKVASIIRVKAYFSGNTDQTITLGTIPAGKLQSFDVNYGYIRGKFTNQPLYYDVWAEVSGVRKSFVQRYIINTEEYQFDDLFVFENTVGGIDTVRFTGQSKSVDSFNSESALMDDVTHEYFSEAAKANEKNSGFFRTDRHRLWALELFASTQRYHVSEDVLKKILVTKPELTAIKGELNNFIFTYQPAKQTKFLNLPRADALPTNLEIIGPGDEVFFLAPRLNEFPSVADFNDIIFPAQFAYTGEWRKYTFSTLVNTLIEFIESAGGGDFHSHINKHLLDSFSKNDGYLFSDFDKIKSGFADHAAEADHATEADHALEADNAEHWNYLKQPDYLTQPVRPEDEPKFKGTGSPAFQSGFSGSGWEIKERNGDIHATVDKLTVRKEMSVYELIVNQIRATNGSVWISDAIKLLDVTVAGSNYNCTIDTDENRIGVPFVVNDILRCQRWTGRNIKYYVARVTAISNGTFTLVKLDGEGIPEANDDVVRMGNVTDISRQGAIYLTASDDQAPYMDVIDQVTSASLAGKTKVRLGKLDGINDPDFGPLGGYGLYGQSVYLTDGHFKGVVNVTGGNAATQIYANDKALEAKNAAIGSAAADATAKDNALKLVAQNYADSVALSQANVAKAAAIAAASSDAQTKADAARVLAENMAQQLVDGVEEAIVDAEQKAVAAQNAYNTLTGQLKGMAYKDVVALADLGTSVIQGGKLTNTLIDTNYIRTNIINASYVESLDIAAKRIVIGGTAQDPKTYVEGMIGNIQVGGVNLLTNSENEWVAGNEYGVYRRDNELSDIFSKGEITISFDIRFPIVTNGACQVYSDNPIGGNPRYSFGATVYGVSTEWQRKKVTVTPTLYTPASQHSNLEFYATYGTGQVPHIRNVKIEIGNIATAWTLAPQEQWSGGRNLLLNSGSAITTSNYFMVNYVLSETITPGESCVLTIRGNLGAGKTYFGAYTNGGSVNQALLSMVSLGVYRAYFKWKASDSNFIIYQLYSDVTSTSTIFSIKLERGTMASDWTPANEDFKSLAYKEAVALADLGATVIQGGKLTNSLIDTNYIRTNVINAAYMETLDIKAKQLRTGDGPGRISLNENNDNLFKFRHANGVEAVKFGLIGGKPVMEWYNDTGEKTWEAGQAGIIYVETIPERWIAERILFVGNFGSTLNESNKDSIRSTIQSWSCRNNNHTAGVTADRTAYNYNAGKNASSPSNEIYNGVHTTQSKSTSNWIPDGWYVTAGFLFLEIDGSTFSAQARYLVAGKQVKTERVDDIYIPPGVGTCPSPF